MRFPEITTGVAERPPGDAGRKPGRGMNGETGQSFDALLGEIAETITPAGTAPPVGQEGRLAPLSRKSASSLAAQQIPEQPANAERAAALIAAASALSLPMFPAASLPTATSHATTTASEAEAGPTPPLDNGATLAVNVGRVKAYIREQATHFAPVKDPGGGPVDAKSKIPGALTASLANTDRMMGDVGVVPPKPTDPSETPADIANGRPVPPVAVAVVQSPSAAAVVARPTTASSRSEKDQKAGPSAQDEQPIPVVEVGHDLASDTSPDRGDSQADDRAAKAAPDARSAMPVPEPPPLTLPPGPGGASSAPAVRQIADAIAAAAADAPTAPATGQSAPLVRTMTIELHPAELGVVTAKLRLTGSALSVKLTAGRPETARLLRREESSLKQLLSADGHAVEVGGIDVSAAGSPSSPANAQSSAPAGNAPSGGGWQAATSGEPGSGNGQAYRERPDDNRSQPREGDRDPPPPRDHPGDIYV
jgi:flagellar hook-length control protein FliK